MVGDDVSSAGRNIAIQTQRVRIRRTIPGISKLQASAGSRTIPILEVIRADDGIESHLHTNVDSMPWIPSTQRQ